MLNHDGGCALLSLQHVKNNQLKEPLMANQVKDDEDNLTILMYCHPTYHDLSNLNDRNSSQINNKKVLPAENLRRHTAHSVSCLGGWVPLRWLEGKELGPEAGRDLGPEAGAPPCGLTNKLKTLPSHVLWNAGDNNALALRALCTLFITTDQVSEKIL